MSVALPIEFVVEWTVKPGMLSEFTSAAERATERVRANEPGALRYVWYLDRETFLLTECYADSEAVLAHLRNIAPILPELSRCADNTRFEILGNLSEEAERAVAPLRASRFHHVHGLIR